QGESLREVLAGNTTNDWRDAMYYHYYEHPSQHNVYRHYGVRTNNYKLIHFYYDEDYWELYDLQKDPHEMNNVYDNAEYAELVINLKNKLKELQVKYKEPNPKSYLEEYIANQKEEVKNLALKAPIKYITSYSDKYKGTGDYPLTDGFIKKITKHTAGEYSGYVGYEEKNMEIVLEYQGSENAETVNLFSIENVGAWIFRPQKVAFLISDNNKDFELLEAPKEIELISEEGTIRLQYKAELKGKSFKYLKIIAENIGFCPKGHVGENLPAWLFVDEIAVQ
ncbi:MAG: sulfatase/phosphatase domain-containing protein, partial [Bacteroidota bacterium]